MHSHVIKATHIVSSPVPESEEIRVAESSVIVEQRILGTKAALLANSSLCSTLIKDIEHDCIIKRENFMQSTVHWN